MKIKDLRKIALIAAVGWGMLLIVSTAVFPYVEVMHDNSTIVELAIGEGLLMLSYDVVYDDEVRSLANTSFMGASAYGPPTFSKFVKKWKMYFGVDCAIHWPDQHKTSRFYGVSLWLVVVVFAAIALVIRCFGNRCHPKLRGAEPGGDGMSGLVSS